LIGCWFGYQSSHLEYVLPLPTQIDKHDLTAYFTPQKKPAKLKSPPPISDPESAASRPGEEDDVDGLP